MKGKLDLINEQSDKVRYALQMGTSFQSEKSGLILVHYHLKPKHF